MIFALFALAIAAVFFASSLILLNYGRHLGLRYLQRQKETANMAGLATVEGAVFGLIGLLLAFTISGALQRFDERRQLVVQEANAASTAYDRLGLFEGDVGRNLQTKLKDYVEARIDLYRMPHDFSLWRRSELFSPEQQEKTVDLKNKVWDATVAACPQASFRPACAQALPALTSLFEVARLRLGASEKHPPQIVYVMLFGLGLGGSLLAGFGMAAATARSWVHMRRHLNGYALRRYGHGISAARPDSHRGFRSFSCRCSPSNATARAVGQRRFSGAFPRFAFVFVLAKCKPYEAKRHQHRSHYHQPMSMFHR